jgi:hypothetical protein
MPVMPRTSKKLQRIVDRIQGKTKKKGSQEPKTETEKRIAYEETSRIR